VEDNNVLHSTAFRYYQRAFFFSLCVCVFSGIKESVQSAIGEARELSPLGITTAWMGALIISER
jgi:hypothetical protein